MSDRVLIGYVDGRAVFRVAKPGKSAYSTDIEDFNVHEDYKIFRGRVKSSVSFSSSGTQNVVASGLSGPYLVSVQASDGAPPAKDTHLYATGTDTYFAILISETTLQIRNLQNVARTIHYCVFGNRLDEDN